MWLCHTFSPNSATPPPLSLWHLTCGLLWHEKPSQSQVSSGPRETLRKPSRVAVNRDPFRHLRFGKTLQRRQSLQDSIESPVPARLCHRGPSPRQSTCSPAFTVSASLGSPGSAAAHACSTRSARSTVLFSDPIAITRTCRPFLRYAEKNFVALPLEMIEDESGTPAGVQEINK